MTRRYHVLTDSERCEIYDMVTSGQVTRKEAATDFGVSEATVGNILRKFRLAEEKEEERAEMPGSAKVIAGNKHDGTLSTVSDHDRIYEGSCRLRNGKFARKRFRAEGGLVAKGLWERWCEEVRCRDGVGEAVEDLPDWATGSVREEVPVESEARTTKAPDVRVSEAVKVEAQSEEVPEARDDGALYLLANSKAGRFLLYHTLEVAMQAQEDMERAAGFMGVECNVDVYEVKWGD